MATPLTRSTTWAMRTTPSCVARGQTRLIAGAALPSVPRSDPPSTTKDGARRTPEAHPQPSCQTISITRRVLSHRMVLVALAVADPLRTASTWTTVRCSSSCPRSTTGTPCWALASQTGRARSRHSRTRSRSILTISKPSHNSWTRFKGSCPRTRCLRTETRLTKLPSRSR
jgi:hypothetical protein